jgi:hypothetical protein
MWTAILVSAAMAQQVEGLRPGESVRPGSPEASLTARECVRGRLIDSRTARPVVGGTLELWTEGLGPAPRKVATAASASDGSFALLRRGEDKADKLIVHAAGYRSTLTSTSDADEILLWPRATHLGLRITDLEGRPIAGTRAETRQTCAHAPPAFEAVSDAGGVIDLATFPPLADGPELFITAQGYAGTLLAEHERMFSPGGLELRLGRARPVAMTVVDSDGKPLAGRRVGFGGEPDWYSLATDAHGRVEFAQTGQGAPYGVELEHQGKSEYLAGGLRPWSFEPRLVFFPADHPRWRERADPALLLPVHVIDETGAAVETLVGVQHEGGAEFDGVRGLEKDWRGVRLVVGGPFTGFDEVVQDLGAAAQTTLRVRREPRLSLLLPADRGSWEVTVQAGPDSVRLRTDSSPLALAVPRGQPLVVFAESSREHGRERRLGRREGLEQDGTLDLTGDGARIAEPPVSVAGGARRVLAQGGPLKGRVRLREGNFEQEDLFGAFVFSTALNAAYEGWISAEGAVPRALGPWDPPVLEATLAWRGSLTVRGPLKALVAGGREAEALEEGLWRVEDLAPGPLLADAVLADGRVLRLELTLADGESRMLTIP